jgi:5-methylcytosine-specific restriction endonuclease McrA
VLEIDHVVPKSRGGTDAESNLVAACEDCNRGKGATTEMRLEWIDLPNGRGTFEYPDHTRPSAAELRELLA